MHSDIGGGNNNRSLNWVALQWLYQEAIRFGLPIDPAAVAANLATRVDPMQISDHRLDLGVKRAVRNTDLLHVTVQLGPGIAGRPHNDPAFALHRIDDAGDHFVAVSSGAHMPKGSLTIEVTNARGGALSGQLHIRARTTRAGHRRRCHGSQLQRQRSQEL